ncbi:hypothetical protein MTO96_009929 [Rhipicephalus appendiculatus]
MTTRWNAPGVDSRASESAARFRAGSGLLFSRSWLAQDSRRLDWTRKTRKTTCSARRFRGAERRNNDAGVQRL